MSFALKLDRALIHAKALDAEVQAWINSDPCTVVDEPDPEPPLEDFRRVPHIVHRRFRVTRIERIPEGVSLLIGDSVFNMRAALDHLAFALATAHMNASGSAMTKRQESSSEFPVFSAGPMDKSEETKKIGCVAPGAKVAIKLLQPHHRGSAFRDDPLWQIHELNRIDKHRKLTVCSGCSMHIADDGVGWEGIGFTKHDEWNVAQMPAADVLGGELKLDAILMRYAATPLDPSRDVYMKPAITPQIVFGDGGPLPFKPVVPTLYALHKFVGENVFSEITKFL